MLSMKAVKKRATLTFALAVATTAAGAASAATMPETIHAAAGHWRGYEADGSRLDFSLTESSLAGVAATATLTATTEAGVERKLAFEIVEVAGAFFVLSSDDGKPALSVTRSPAGTLIFQRLLSSEEEGAEELALERVSIGKLRADASRTLSWEISAKSCRASDHTLAPCGDGSTVKVVAKAVE